MHGNKPQDIEHITNAVKIFGKRDVEVIGKRIEDVKINFNRSIKLSTKMRYICEGALSYCYRCILKN